MVSHKILPKLAHTTKNLWHSLFANVRRKKPVHGMGPLEVPSQSQPDFLANPYPYYHKLRDINPVYFEEESGRWLVTGYAEALVALRNPRLGVTRLSRFMDLLPQSCQRQTTFLRDVLSLWLFLQDPPHHTEMKERFHQIFRPACAARLPERIARLSESLLDLALDHREGQTFDLVRSLADPLPTMVLADLLGFPLEDWTRIHHWVTAIADFISATHADPLRAMHAQYCMKEFAEYIKKHLGVCSDNHESTLAFHPCGANDLELIACYTVLFSAAVETTSGLIGNALLALLGTRRQLAALPSDDAGMVRAVEEFLRYDSPVQYTVRTPQQDIELSGNRIQAGLDIILFLGAANRDPRQFPEPDQLKLNRRENHHLAFSHGIHYCPGASLARLEMRIVLQTLLARLPYLALGDASPSRRRNTAFRGLASLPVRPLA